MCLSTLCVCGTKWLDVILQPQVDVLAQLLKRQHSLQGGQEGKTTGRGGKPDSGTEAEDIDAVVIEDGEEEGRKGDEGVEESRKDEELDGEPGGDGGDGDGGEDEEDGNGFDEDAKGEDTEDNDDPEEDVDEAEADEDEDAGEHEDTEKDDGEERGDEEGEDGGQGEKGEADEESTSPGSKAHVRNRRVLRLDCNGRGRKVMAV